MSVRVMGNVWELDLDPAHKFVLLAMADHADHDGGSVHPSVRMIAHKTGYSERQVQRIIRALEEARILVVEGPSTGGRGHTTHYRIVIANGDKLPPFRKGDNDAERVTSGTANGDIPATKGDIRAVKGDTYVTRTVIEPSIEPSEEPTPPNPPRRAADLVGFEEWWTLFPRKENKAKAREIWKRLRPSPELVATIIAQTSAYAVCDKVQRGYVMLPTTYLNGRRWEDDLAPPAPVQPFATRPGQRLTSEQIMARARLFDQEERRS